MSGWLLNLGGVSLVLLTVTDIFLTVLHARGGAGILSPALSTSVWGVFRRSAQLLPQRYSSAILSFAGPSLLVATVLTWALLLAVGFAFIIWPGLGTGVTASQGPTPTDFWTALYYSGYSLTTLGIGDLAPKTSFYRLLTILEAGIGFSVFTLTLTYFMSVYGVLTRRNTLATLLDQMSGGSGDAAELLARLGPNGDFSPSRSDVTHVANEVLALLEAHHAYPVLHYFRRESPSYAMARVALVALDTASLARSALDDEHHRTFVWSAATEALWGSGMKLLSGTQSFVPREGHVANDEFSWRARFSSAVQRLQEAGISIAPDAAQGGVERYLALRGLWDGDVRGLAAAMEHNWTEIAPHEVRLSSAV